MELYSKIGYEIFLVYILAATAMTLIYSRKVYKAELSKNSP